MVRKTGKVGGQYNNRSAVKHGGYTDLTPESLDGRTKIARTLREVEATLATALGDPSPQEVILIRRASVKALRCSLVEQYLLTEDRNAAQGLRDDYLRWARELRADLLALGLKRRPRDVTDLAVAFKENER